MKYLREFRDTHLAQLTLDKIHQTVNKPWVLLEICEGTCPPGLLSP